MSDFVVFGFAPRSGPPDTVITVTGSGFTNATAAWLAAQASPKDIGAKICSDDQLQITVPNDAPPGAAFFSIQNPEPGASALSIFTVTERA